MAMIRPNYFVSDYLEALKEYNKDLKALEDDNQKEARYNAALAEADRIAGDVQKDIAKWSVLKPDQRHSDANLLSAEYGVLSIEELTALVTKHRENYTMLRILSVYAVAHYGENHGIHFITVDGKRTAYAQIHESALSMIERIHKAPVDDSVLNAWMLPADNPGIYAEIGGERYPDL